MKKLLFIVAFFWPLTLIAQGISISSIKEYYVIDTVRYEIYVETWTYTTEQGREQFTYYGPATVVGIATKNYEGELNLPGSIEYKDTLLKVEEIGAGAFRDCSGITTVNIPKEIKTIGSQAFENCIALQDIHIDEGVEIGAFAFDNTAWFDRQEDGIVYLAKVAYAYKGKKPKNGTLEITDGTLSIAGGAFDCEYFRPRNTKELTSISIPGSVTSIGTNAFRGCSSLNDINIPSSIKCIGNDAFYGCSGLTKVHITDLLSWCKIDFPNSQYPYSNPLYYAHHLYLNGELVTHIKVPESISTINMTFYGATDIVSVEIPENVTRISNLAFEGCKLETVLTKNANVSFNGGSFSQRTMQHAMLYIPEGTWNDAVYVGDWYLFNNIREVAMTTENLSYSKAYCLMDSETYGYTVYDPADRTTKRVKAFYSIDDSDPVNSWQIVESTGNKYLYNIGAKKYASFRQDGTVELNDSPQPIHISDGQNGIRIGNKEWYLVLNHNVSIDANVVKISTTPVSAESVLYSYYSLDGRHISKPRKGLNVVKNQRWNY